MEKIFSFHCEDYGPSIRGLRAEESLAIMQAPGLQLVRLKQTPDATPAESDRPGASRG